MRTREQVIAVVGAAAEIGGGICLELEEAMRLQADVGVNGWTALAEALAAEIIFNSAARKIFITKKP